MRSLAALAIVLASTAVAGAQYYARPAYAYPGRGYYAGGGHYAERYAQHYAPPARYTRPPAPHYAPPGGYNWGWGGGDRAYTGGRGGGWGGEW